MAPLLYNDKNPCLEAPGDYQDRTLCHLIAHSPLPGQRVDSVLVNIITPPT